MLAPTQQVGRLQVTCLLDAAGPSGLGPSEGVFPDATEDDWAAARRIDPAAFGLDGSWHLCFQCFVIRGPGDRVVLVDTGVGPQGSPALNWAPGPGRLLEALDEIGIGTEDVDLVVQTHLHSDHLGWAVTPDGVPVFPHARYVIQRDEVAVLEQSDSALVPYVVKPLRDTGQLHEINGREHLLGGHGGGDHRVVAIPTPGHTPGHQSVLVEDRDDQVVITGDVLVHAVQLANPAVAYAHELDPDRARSTRQTLLSDVHRRGALLATAHLNHAFMPVG